MSKENSSVLELVKRDKEKKLNQLRKEMKVPGVIYGGTIDGGQPIYVEEGKLNEMLKNNTKASVIPVSFDGKKGNVIVKEVKRNNLTNKVDHIDFQAIKKNEVLTLELPLVFTGEESVAHRKLLINANINTLSVKGPADTVPESIEVEVGELNLDDKVFAKDIKLPSGIELVTPEDELVVSLAQSSMEKDLDKIEESEEAAADETAEVPEIKEENEKES